MSDNILTIACVTVSLVSLVTLLPMDASAQSISSPVSASVQAVRSAGSRVVQQGVQDDMPASVNSLVERLRRMPGTALEGKLTLRELVVTLNQSGVPTLLDLRRLEEENLSPNKSIEFPRASVSIDDRLSLALDPIDCGWTVTAKGNAILITSRNAIEESLMVVTYDLNQLAHSSDLHSIINAITSTVDPESWEDVGGNGTIEVVNIRGRDLLVVASNYHIHREVSRLLNSLHRMGGSALPRGGRRTRSSSLSMRVSQPIALPERSTKRGINLPGSNSRGNMGGFGGGMMGMGGMF